LRDEIRMPEQMPYGKRNWYPHLGPEDRAVWEQFIDQNPALYETVEYDVPVGTVPEFVMAHEDDAMRKQEKLYKKKIDVVARVAGRIDIIELKPLCTFSTIGQVRGYKFLYIRDYSPTVEPAAIVICAQTTPDVLEHAKAEGVEVIVV